MRVPIRVDLPASTFPTTATRRFRVDRVSATEETCESAPPLSPLGCFRGGLSCSAAMAAMERGEGSRRCVSIRWSTNSARVKTPGLLSRFSSSSEKEGIRPSDDFSSCRWLLWTSCFLRGVPPSASRSISPWKNRRSRTTALRLRPRSSSRWAVDLQAS